MAYQVNVKKLVKSNFLGDESEYKNIQPGIYDIDDEKVARLNLVERFAKFPNLIELIKVVVIIESKEVENAENKEVDNTVEPVEPIVPEVPGDIVEEDENQTEANVDKYEDITVAQLKEMLDAKQIKYNTKAKKDELIALVDGD